MHIYDKDLNFQVRRAGDSNLTRWVSVTVARCCDCVSGRLGARVGAASLRGRGGEIHPARQVTAGVARLVLSSSTLTRPSLPLSLSLPSSGQASPAGRVSPRPGRPHHGGVRGRGRRAERSHGRVSERGGEGEPAAALRGHRQRPSHQHLHARRRRQLRRVSVRFSLALSTPF